MANHIYILYMIISFCTGMVFLTPSLVLYLRKGQTFRYYNNYKYFFHCFIAFTALIFSNSIHHYIINNIADAGAYAYITVIIIELISIHMFLLFLPLFIHNFFAVKSPKPLNIFFVILSLLSLIIFIILFSKNYVGDLNNIIKDKILAFPIASVYNGIFAVIILYSSIICILYFKKLNDDVLQKMVITNLILIVTVFFSIFIRLIFQSETNFTNSISLMIYIMPGFYLIWSIISSYFCVKYYLFEPSSDPGNFSLEHFAKEYELTSRETEIAKLLIRGCGNTEISEELSISIPTVKSHISNIFKKAGCARRTELLSIIFHGI